MKLGISAISYIEKKDGISIYIENLLLALVREFSKTNETIIITVFACGPGAKLLKAFYDKEINATKANNVDIQFVTYEEDNWYVKYVKVPLKLWKRGPFHQVILPNMQPLVLVRNSTLSVLHDLTYKVSPDHFSPAKKLYFDGLTRFRMWSDGAIGYISESTKKDLTRYYPSSTKKPLVYLPNGIPSKTLKTPRPYRKSIERKWLRNEIQFLFVGRINKLKGFDLVQKIITYFDQKVCDLPMLSVTLHVVGKQTNEGRQLLDSWHCRNVKVTIHGHIEDGGLNRLYRSSAFCLFLSRNEGFGLPVVESLWFGCVPILSRIPIFEELMGGNFSFFMDNDDIGSRVYDFVMSLRGNDMFRRETLDMMESALDRHREGYQTAASVVADLCRSKRQWQSSLEDEPGNRIGSEHGSFVSASCADRRGADLGKI